MTWLPMRFAMLLAAGLAAWQPSKAQANPEDTQFWLVGFVRGDLGDDVFLTIDTSYRWRDPAFGADQHTLRVTVEKGVDDNLRIGGGLSYFQTGPRTEIRPHQQLRYARGGLDLRTRFEQRFFEGGRKGRAADPAARAIYPAARQGCESDRLGRMVRHHPAA